MSRSDGSTHVAVWGMIGLAAAFGALAMVTMSIGPASIPIWMFTVGGAALIFRGPIGKAIAKRISGEADAGATSAIGSSWNIVTSIPRRRARR